MTFKCDACDHWHEGEGSLKCLNCREYRYVGHEKSRLVVEYYANPFEEIGAPESFESLYHVSRKQTIWDLINKLDWRQATMLTQYYFLEMTQADIAEYHGINQTKVNRIIAKSIELIKNN